MRFGSRSFGPRASPVRLFGVSVNRVVYASVQAGERLIGFSASAAIAPLTCVKSLNASRGRLRARFRSAWSVSVEFSAWPIFWPMFRSR